MTVALYPGTFDPATRGHVDVANRASSLFSRLVVAVYEGSQRPCLFTAQERVDLFSEAVQHLENVNVQSFSGLVVNYARQTASQVIVRGLRGGSDFEYEYEMAFVNKKLAPDIETVCLITSLEYQFVSSSRLKEVASLGGDIGVMVPPHVAKAVLEKLALPRNS
jgi:pantetheine-phosphate adenylyltransferase